MDGIDPEAVWFVGPCFADSFIGCETTQGLKASGEVVSIKEGSEVIFQLPWVS